jgi:hypothetical protein
VQVGKVSHSGEEVLALKRLIQRCTSDQEKLREQIGRNKDKDEFCMSHRWGGEDGQWSALHELSQPSNHASQSGVVVVGSAPPRFDIFVFRFI